VAVGQVEQKISELLGAQHYEEMRRNLTAITELDLPTTTG
jgi:hypothetical protein